MRLCNIICLVILLFSYSCSTTKIKSIKDGDFSYCGDDIELSYRLRTDSKYEYESYKKYKKNIKICFETGFNDSIAIFFNNKPHFGNNHFIKSHLSIRTSIIFKNRKKSPLLRIESLNNNYCLEIKIDPRYSYLYLNRLNDKWYIEYSNLSRFLSDIIPPSPPLP